MKYLVSIFATVLTLIGCAAFMAEIGTYGFAPPAQWIVMLFLLLFTVLCWVAQSRSDEDAASRNENLYYRLIAENVVFPAVGYLIQGIIAIFYFSAWNAPWWSGNLTLRHILPSGFFIPLLVEVLLTIVVISLWVGNITANVHTVRQQVMRDEKVANRAQLKSQVLFLDSCLDPNDKEATDISSQIQRKVESLPLVPDAATGLFYSRAINEIQEATAKGSVDLPTLQHIRDTLNRVR